MKSIFTVLNELSDNFVMVGMTQCNTILCAIRWGIFWVVIFIIIKKIKGTKYK